MKAAFKNHPAEAYLRCMREAAGKPVAVVQPTKPKRLDGGCLLFKLQRLA